MAGRGQPKMGGRKHGTPNRLNAEVKEMVRQALHEAGGVAYLKRQALKTNPVAFMTLVGKLMPTELKAEVEDIPLVIIRAYAGPRAVQANAGIDAGGVRESQQSEPCSNNAEREAPSREPAERVIPGHGMPVEEDELEVVPKSKPLRPRLRAALL